MQACVSAGTSDAVVRLRLVVVTRVELDEEQELTVFRLLRSDDPSDSEYAEGFMSNGAKGRAPRGREQEEPLIHDGISVFKQPDQARRLRSTIAAKQRKLGREPLIGDFLATLVLVGPEVFYEDRDEPSGHMTIWGEPSRLMASVVEITPIED